MANFSVHFSKIKRSRGENAVAASAYISRSKLSQDVVCEDTGEIVTKTWDYRHLGGLGFSKIFVPEKAPDWAHDRQKLWNKVEEFEKLHNSHVGARLRFSLPIELNKEQHEELVTELAERLVDLGMVVDANVHYDKPHNPHAHFQMTEREFVLNKEGEYVFNKAKNREWGGPKFIHHIREEIANITNEHLAKAGFDERVSHLSHKERGIDLKPGVHEGPARHIPDSELAELNEQIRHENNQAILEHPELVLDRIAISKPVFTKEDISKALMEVLEEEELALKEDYGNSAEEHQETATEAAEDQPVELSKDDRAQITQRFNLLFNKVMAAPELTPIIKEDLKGRELFARTKRVKLEQRFLDNVDKLANSDRHKIAINDSDLDKLSTSEKIIREAKEIAKIAAIKLEQKTGIKINFSEEIKLSAEQRKAVVEILNGNDISALTGLPGSGKTQVMKEVARQYRKKGKRVIGLAPSSTAALQLSASTGIVAKNASLWRKEWQQAKGKKFELVLRADYYDEDQYKDNKRNWALNSKTVMIIDEASMMELANLDYFINEAIKAGAKVLVLGDNNQLQAIGYMGGYLQIVNMVGSSHLSETRRQSNETDREATKLMSNFKMHETLKLYQGNGRLEACNGQQELEKKVVNDFVDQYLAESEKAGRDDMVAKDVSVIACYTNDKAQRINNKVRERLKLAGVLKGKEVMVNVGTKKLALCRGDQIVFNSNVNREGVYNGEVGTILKVGRPDKLGNAILKIRVNKGNDRFVTKWLTTKDIERGKLLDYGYAMTIYKLQGKSVDNVSVAYESNMGYEGLFVAMSRHRHSVKMYYDYHEVLDGLYFKLDIDLQKAKDRYQINFKSLNKSLSEHLKDIGYSWHDIKQKLEKEGEEINFAEPLWFIGLKASVSKRVNNSFAIDYQDMGQRPEDKLISNYIESNKRAIELIREISQDLAALERKSNKKYQIWQHELWPEFKSWTDKRDNLAGKIVDDYDSFKQRLVQLEMNYQTVLKHASGGQLDQYDIHEKESHLYQTASYEALIEHISQGNDALVYKSYQRLKNEIADNYAVISKVREQISQCKESVGYIEANIQQEQKLRQSYIYEYLSRIYEDEPEAVLEKWQGLRDSYNDKKQELASSKLRPSSFGKLRGVGVWSILSLSAKRKDAIKAAEKLHEMLTLHDQSKVTEDVLKGELADYPKKERELNDKLAGHLDLLPSSLDERLFDEIELHIDAFEAAQEEDASGEISKKISNKVFNRVNYKIKELGADKEYEVAEHSPSAQKSDMPLSANSAKSSDGLINQQLSDYSNNDSNAEAKAAEEGDKSQSSESAIAALDSAAESHNRGNDTAEGKKLSRAGPRASKISNQISQSIAFIDCQQQEANALSAGSSYSAVGRGHKAVEEFLSNYEEAKAAEQIELQTTSGSITGLSAESREHDGSFDKGDGYHNEAIQSGTTRESSAATTENKTSTHDSTIEAKTTENSQESQPAKQETLSELASRLTPEIISQIFCDLVPALNAKDEINIRGNQITAGSINMNLNNGLWYRFSDQSKGNIYHFICEAKDCSIKEAVKTVKDYLETGKSKENNTDDRLVLDSIKKTKEEWALATIKPDHVKPFDAKYHLNFMLDKHNLESVHRYCNGQGELLGYTVRLVAKETGKKQVVPVALCWHRDSGKYSWRLKGFSDKGDKPIYRLEQIIAGKPIVIVEGEKTADKAAMMLKEYNVVSWLGGSGAADKVRWQQLSGHEVIIWPDNDEAGRKAANVIADKIDSANGFNGMVSIIDTNKLKLPEKWDLADKLPEHLQLPKIKAILAEQVKSNNSLGQNQINLSHNDAENIQALSELASSNLAKLGIDLAQNPEYKARLEHELKIISKTGFAQEFIIASNICQFAKEHSITIGEGRGSCVSSLTCYGLGIHEVDPIKHGLIFERFLTENSTKQPDFDIDVASSKKQILENYVFANYDNAYKMIVRNKHGEITTHPAGILFLSKEQIKSHKIEFDYNHKRKGMKPVKRALVDKHMAEELSFRKIDLLSSPELSRLDAFEEKTGHRIKDINYNDSKTLAKFNSGSLQGVFQFSSDYASKIAANNITKCFNDVVALQAKIRPGAKEIKHNFSDPKQILKTTNNQLLFQEQIMELGHQYYNLDMAKANDLRRSIAKAGGKLDAKLKSWLINAGIEQGKLQAQDSKELCHVLEQAGGYRFNKAHGVATSMRTMKTAYIKTHYPEEFEDIFSKGKNKPQKDLTQENELKDNKLIAAEKVLISQDKTRYDYKGLRIEMPVYKDILKGMELENNISVADSNMSPERLIDYLGDLKDKHQNSIAGLSDQEALSYDMAKSLQAKQNNNMVTSLASSLIKEEINSLNKNLSIKEQYQMMHEMVNSDEFTAKLEATEFMAKGAQQAIADSNSIDEYLAKTEVLSQLSGKDGIGNHVLADKITTLEESGLYNKAELLVELKAAGNKEQANCQLDKGLAKKEEVEEWLRWQSVCFKDLAKMGYKLDLRHIGRDVVDMSRHERKQYIYSFWQKGFGLYATKALSRLEEEHQKDGRIIDQLSYTEAKFKLAESLHKEHSKVMGMALKGIGRELHDMAKDYDMRSYRFNKIKEHHEILTNSKGLNAKAKADEIIAGSNDIKALEKSLHQEIGKQLSKNIDKGLQHIKEHGHIEVHNEQHHAITHRFTDEHKYIGHYINHDIYGQYLHDTDHHKQHQRQQQQQLEMQKVKEYSMGGMSM